MMGVVARASSARGIRETETRHGSALGMLLVILAEFRQAIAATRRYEALRCRSARDGPAEISRRVFEEFYSLDSE